MFSRPGLSEYLLSQQGAQELERSRLALLQEYYDPLSVKQLDAIGIGDAPFEQSAFDLVHARLLLMHLPSRLKALRRLTAAARSGGSVAAIDPDFTTVALSPPNPTWERTWSVFFDALSAGGWDPGYGACLCSSAPPHLSR